MIDNLINEQIKQEKILLIDENGTNVGITNCKQALCNAKNLSLDLVCINPKSSPVVCKIMDYSKYKYNLNKKEKENKANNKTIELKKIQFRPQIDTNDMQVKIKKCKEELQKGNKIKVLIVFKGRQLLHKEIGFELMNKIISELEGIGSKTKDPVFSGNMIECVLEHTK